MHLHHGPPVCGNHVFDMVPPSHRAMSSTSQSTRSPKQGRSSPSSACRKYCSHQTAEHQCSLRVGEGPTLLLLAEGQAQCSMDFSSDPLPSPPSYRTPETLSPQPEGERSLFELRCKQRYHAWFQDHRVQQFVRLQPRIGEGPFLQMFEAGQARLPIRFCTPLHSTYPLLNSGKRWLKPKPDSLIIKKRPSKQQVS